MIVGSRYRARVGTPADDVVAVVAALVAWNPEASDVDAFGLLAVGVPATFVGLAWWSFATGVLGD